MSGPRLLHILLNITWVEVNWSVRAHSAAPKQRVLDVHAGEDDDGIFSDESDTEFAAEEVLCVCSDIFIHPTAFA